MRTVLQGQLLLLLAAGVFVTNAHAHKIRVFAWQEGDMIFTEAKFSGGRPARNVSVVVENPMTGERLLTGQTDEEGNFQFVVPVPRPEQLNIVIDGGDGHKNSWTHTLETTDQGAVTAPPPEPPVNERSSSSATDREAHAGVEPVIQGIDAEQLKAVLETVVDQKLSPIKKSLAAMQEKGPSLQDILGGIGYILGLAGIAAYFKSKRQ
jgi:nickel transport protein